MKRALYYTLLFVCSGGMLATTSEFRSPLSLYHVPLWYSLAAQDDGAWVVESWDGLYCRSARQAYVPQNKCRTFSAICPTSCCNKQSATLLETDACGCVTHGSTRHTEQLAALFFGKSVFRVEEAFAGGQLDNEQLGAAKNPSLIFSRLSPRFEYTEKGLICGVNVHRKFGDQRTWRAGLRASLPFKHIDVEHRSGCTAAEGSGDSFNGVANMDLYNSVADGSQMRQTYAYRLDYLSSLAYPVESGCAGTQEPFVDYGTGGSIPCTDDVTTIGMVNVGVEDPPVVVFYSPSGCIPSTPKPGITIAGTLDKSGTTYNGGTPLVPGQWYTFDQTKDYASGLGQDRDAQSDLWIGPSFEGTNPQPAAQNIHETVQFMMNTLDANGEKSPESFLSDRCIFMRDTRVAGVGDLDTQLYVGYHPHKEWYTDIFFGVRYPTGQKAVDSGDLLYMPTGNNGHFEVSGAVEGGWNPCCWLAVRSYLSGTHVCSATEKRAAPFEGATIRNIGPTVDVDISYNYFLGNLDFTFYHPEHTHSGCSVGYQLYARGKDAVSCCRTPCVVIPCECAGPIAHASGSGATDLLGLQRPLDCTLLQCGTNTMTHKLRADIFHRCSAGYCELFGGVSQVVGGRYAMRETEAHIGVTINF